MKHSIYTNAVSRSIGTLMLLMMLLLVGCRQDDDLDIVDADGPSRYPADVALRWNELLLDLERYTTGYRPPVSARTTAYINLAAYEAIQPGMAADYNSLEGEFPGLVLPEPDPAEEYHWPTVLTATYSRAMELFFPTAPSEQLYKIFDLRDELLKQYRQAIPLNVYTRSLDYGTAVAQDMFAWSATDTKGHAAFLRNNDPTYQPPSGTGLWRPTYPDYAEALLPHWGQTRTFVATEEDIVPDPLPYVDDPGSPIYQQALEVKDMVEQIEKGQLADYKWMAEFWSDDCPILTFTPAGRWLAVANQLIAGREVKLDMAVETYARLGIGLCDAGIRCWHEKYRFNLERPIDYIRRVMGDSDWNTIMCPDGSGNFFTPPFPAYPSGHATFGAVAAEVLTELYGRNYRFTDRCHEGRTEFNGTPRSFNSFYAMAEENAFSRVPLGVHFRMDSDAGLDLGYRIGKKVNALPWRK